MNARAMVKSIGLGIAACVFLTFALIGWSRFRQPPLAVQAERAIAAGDVPAAIPLLTAHLEQQPGDERRRMLLAACVAESTPTEALVHLEQIPEDSALYREARIRTAQLLSSLNRHRHTLTVWHSLAKRFPDDVEILTRLASESLLFGALDQAKESIDHVIQLQPDSKEVFHTAARIYDALDQGERVIELQERVLQLDPQDEAAHLNLAHAYHKLGQAQESKEHARWCLDKDPNNVQAMYLLAEGLRNTGKVDEAQAILNKIGELAPNHLEARLLLAETLQFQRKYQDALDVLEPLLETHSKHPRLHGLLSTAYRFLRKEEKWEYHRKQQEELMQQRRQLAELRERSLKNPSNQELRLQVAQRYSDLGMQNEALQELQTLLRQQPQHEAALELLRSLERPR